MMMHNNSELNAFNRMRITDEQKDACFQKSQITNVNYRKCINNEPNIDEKLINDGMINERLCRIMVSENELTPEINSQQSTSLQASLQPSSSTTTTLLNDLLPVASNCANNTANNNNNNLNSNNVTIKDCSSQARQEESDISVDELAAYFDLQVHIPKKMSFMAELMYT